MATLMLDAKHRELYEGLGLNLIPLKPRDKRPALASWGAYQYRKSSPAEWGMWWPVVEQSSAKMRDRIFPFPEQRNVGIVTGMGHTIDGRPDNSTSIVVLDFDNDLVYDEACLYIPWLHEQMTVRTGRGWHVYIRPDKPPGATFTLKMEGFEGIHHVKADGGYVVAPPSIHPSGSIYHLDEPERPLQTVQLSILVQALLNAGFERANPEVKERPTGYWDDFFSNTYSEGQRNDTLAHLAGVLRNAIGSEAIAYELAQAWNLSHLKPPLAESEVRSVMRSMYARYEQKRAG